MKPASDALKAFLDVARTGDVSFEMTDCFTITPSVGGASAYFTSFDQPVTFNGHTFAAQSALIQGLKAKATTGLEVDRQQITIAAWPNATINGAPWMEAIRSGVLDGASIQRDRVFISPSLPGGVDGVTMFKGYVSTVDEVGRTSAKLTVASALVVLGYDMPRNMFLPTCVHVLYDAGCAINKAAFVTSTTAGAGSTPNTILGAAASLDHVQGSLVFTDGVNAGNIRSTVQSVVAGVSWTLTYALPNIPTAGDPFEVFFGCDHTLATCTAKFANAVHFRGFPYVPPPDFAF